MMYIVFGYGKAGKVCTTKVEVYAEIESLTKDNGTSRFQFEQMGKTLCPVAHQHGNCGEGCRQGWVG